MTDQFSTLGKVVGGLAIVSVICGVLMVAMGASGAMDGEWQGIASVIVGLLGIASGVMTVMNVAPDTAFNGMNMMVLFAIAMLPYFKEFHREDGVDAIYPAFSVLGSVGMSSSRSVNGEVVQADGMGLSIIGIALVIWAMKARADWMHAQTRASFERERTATVG